jgi:RHS repeat-associated protein
VAVSRITNANVFGYISNVDAKWSCTLYYRYSGVAYNTTSTTGTFDYGAIIHSTSVSCNWVVGSTDYLKANDTADCPDTDAEYAMGITLSPEGTYNNNAAHTATGQFSWVHSDCDTTTFYGANGESVKTGQTFSTGITGNRPGANCDPMVLDNTATSQTITYDNTPPALGFETPAVGSTTYLPSTPYTVGFDATDAVAGFDATHKWTLSRTIADATDGTCGGFAPETPPFVVQGTVNALNQQSVETLADGKCYQWTLVGTDANGKAATAPFSGIHIVDTTPPTSDFTAPDPASQGTQGDTTYEVSWDETEVASGISSRSLQRQKVAPSGATCPATGWANDGSAVNSPSPVSVSGLVLGNCYRWQEILTDRAQLSTTQTSGAVLVDASPTVDFTSPDPQAFAIQNTTSVSLTWTETLGGGPITNRSLQRQVAPISAPNECGTYSNDGAPVPNASPYSPSGLTTGNCYQWIETVTDSLGKQASSSSGVVLIDTAAPLGSIAYPELYRPVAGDVVIMGSATDAQSFKEYQLEYGAGPSPSSWTTIDTVSAEVAGTNPLATWSTGTLSGVYTLRLTVRDYANNTTILPLRTVVIENGQRGDEDFLSRVPFDIGGGYNLDIGVANGEARLSRDLFSIPTFGPPQELGLTYASLETGSVGKFGVGWVSNLTQYLTFDNTAYATDHFITWHGADGGIVPFGLVGSTWTPPAGHFETISHAGSETTITLKDQSRLVFEDALLGRLKRIENRFGKALTLDWTTSTTTATAIDATPSPGRKTTLTIDSVNNRITGATDSAGRIWGFGYTGTDLTSITDPANKTTTFMYDSPNHHLTGIAQTRSRVSGGSQTITWTIGYVSGKATSVTDPDSSPTASTFTYNGGSTDAAILKDALVPAWNVTSYTIDPLGRVTSLVDPQGLTTVSTFSTSATAPLSPLTTTRPIDASTSQTTTRTYDSRGNVLTETDDLDSTHTVTTAMTYNTTNDLLARSEDELNDATRLVTLNTYASGHLTSVDVNCTTTSTTQSSPGTACTGLGTQDAATNLITAYAYTPNDQLLTETDPLGHVTMHVYDPLGNETSVVANCTTTGTTPPSTPSSCTAGGTHDSQTNVTTSHAYDATTAGKAGLATSTTDAVGKVTTDTYDTLGRNLSEVLPGETGGTASIPALTRTTTYDELGNVLTSDEAWTPVGGGSIVHRTTTHAYDLSNRETTQIDPLLVSTTTIYDAAGDATRTVAGGVQTDRTFDSMGRVIDETTGGPKTYHEYDGLGREFHTINPPNGSTNRDYDLAGRLLKETVSDEQADVVTEHIYDPLGREISTIDAAGTTIHTYDRTGRLLTTLVGGGMTINVYDRNGNPTKVTSPQNIVNTTVFDPLNRATQTIGNDVATPTLPTQDVTTTTYYDAAGQTLAVMDSKGITTRSILNVRGLAMQVIANCTDSGTAPTMNPPACTGPIPQATHDGKTNVVTTITYDGSGAETIRFVNHGDGTSATTTVVYEGGRERAILDPRGTVTRILYDPITGHLQSRIVNCTNLTTPGSPTGNWYDCPGSVLNDGTWNLTTSYTYDSRGRKATETAPNNRVTTFLYDDADRLIQRIDNDVATVTNADQDLSTYFGYDNAGQQIAVRTPTIDRDTFTVTRTFFDAAGRTTKVIRNCTIEGVTPPGIPDWITCPGGGTMDTDTNLATTYTYDTKGNRISMLEPDPSDTTGTPATVMTQYAYDTDNRLCRVVENATGGTDLQALASPCTDLAQGTATTTQNVSTKYTSDGSGNLTTMTDARGKTTTYTYDASAHMTGLTDPDSGAIAWTYDNLGRRIGQTNRGDASPGSPTVSWAYDGAGRVVSRAFETAPATDTAPPSVPTGLTAIAVGSRRIDLSWSPSRDNVAVTTYTIRRAGATLTKVSGEATSFSDTGLGVFTAYGYTVDASDAAGNTSAVSTVASVMTLPAAPYADQVVADGASAYWRLGESGGTAAADFLGPNVGSYSGSPTLGVAGGVVGNTAVTLNGTTQYASVPAAPALDLGDVFSIELWFKRGSIGTLQGVLDKGTTGGVAPLIYFAADNTLRLATSSARVAVVSSSAITDTASWHHAVFTKSGGTAHVYIDGVVNDHAGTATTFANSSNGVYLGREVGGTSYFNGSLDEVAIYKTPLTATQVLAHYNARTNTGGGTTYVSDAFTRTGPGWGSADVGGAWTSTNTSEITTNGSSGLVSLPSATSYYTRLPASVADQEGALRVKVSDLTGTGSVAYVRIEPRFNAALSNYYRFQTQFGASGTVDMSLRRVAGGVVTTFRTDTAVVTGVTAGSYVWAKWSVVTSGADVVLKYKLWKDGTGEPASWSTSYTDVAPGGAFTGAGTLQIYSQALAGFTGTYPLVFTYDDLAITNPGGGASLDTTPPTVPTGVTATAVGANRINLAWTASTDTVGVTSYTIRRGGSVISLTSGTTVSFSDYSPAASTLYSYTVSAADAAANSSADSASASATTAAGNTTYASDTFTRTGAGWGTANIGGTWTSTNTTEVTTDGTSGLVSLASVTTHYTRLPASVADQEGRVRVKVSSLTGTGSVAYALVKVRADAGLANYYRFQVQFGASGTVDMSLRKNIAGTSTTLRTDTAVLTGLTAGSYIWTKWSVVNSGADVVLKYKLWKDGTTEPGSWSTSFTDVAPGATFTGAGTLEITSQTLAGFTGTYPYVFTFDDLAITNPGGGGSLDTTPPTVPTGLSATAVGANRINLAWTASTDAVGVQGYLIYRGGTLIATTASTSFVDAGLAASTLYSYTVNAIDGAANASAQTSAQSATTGAAVPDTTAPTVPTGLSAVPAGTTKNELAWTAATDAVGVQGYKIYRGGTFLVTVGSTTWSDTAGLTAATAYSYTVAALDAAGNASAQSTSANATTQAASITTSYSYDANGNRLTVVDPTGMITTNYDRLNRATSVILSADGLATTSYTYSLTSPAWTDPSGSYAVGLDKFDRQVSLTDPIHGASTWSTNYRADGQPLSLAAPNGNTTAFGYDDAGQPLTKTTTAAGPVTRASYALARNRAGQILTEDSQLTGDPTNGQTAYTYDPLARLTGFTRSATTAAYGWDKVPNRTSIQAGAGTPVTTTYTDANRPLADSGGATGAYTSDADGRLTSRPNQRLEWDGLGRLVRVRPATGTAITATYTYDALDRLLTADEGGLRTRYRYVGQTTTVAQTVNDATGLPIRSIGSDWAGERLVDWTTGGANQRFYGTNGHHDVTWTADSTGAVSATLRYDPWGTITSSTGSSTPDFRFQGSLYDSAVDLSWAITRWYAPTMGRFISEDSLLGDVADPPSRHLYAYGAGEPVGAWDPDGRLATCGGLGCTASADATLRKKQWAAFFHRFPGTQCGYHCYGIVPQSGTGNGTAMLAFLDWMIRSGRTHGWWNSVDKVLVQGSLSAWRYFDSGTVPPYIASRATYLWWTYTKGGYLTKGCCWTAGYYGGSLARAWNAHQAGIWGGVQTSGSLVANETFAERVVMWKVLNNLESYYSSGHPADLLLGVATEFGGYPKTYPATMKSACFMTVITNSFVDRFFPKPAGYYDRCSPWWLNPWMP